MSGCSCLFLVVNNLEECEEDWCEVAILKIRTGQMKFNFLLLKQKDELKGGELRLIGS